MPKVLRLFWGLSREEAKEKEEQLLNVKNIKKLEPTVYNQLRREYILSALPHSDGGEFTDGDREMILDIINGAA